MQGYKHEGRDSPFGRGFRGSVTFDRGDQSRGLDYFRCGADQRGLPGCHWSVGAGWEEENHRQNDLFIQEDDKGAVVKDGGEVTDDDSVEGPTSRL